MKRNLLPWLATFAISSTSLVPAQTDQKPYDGSWESLQKMPVPAWFDDGKVGIFIHWGPYSVIGYRKGGRGYSEHVPKMFYTDPKHYYPYMKERWGANPPEFGYKDIIPEFQAEKWDPDGWAELFEQVGAKYVVMTAEHHDGWANWDSDLTPWNAKDMGPKRDLVGDLGKALKKRGLKYAPSYHRERHQSFFAKKQYVVDAVPQDDIVEEIKRVPEAASLYGPFGTSKEFVDDYVARWKEIQTKYQPDFLWMDDFPIYTRDGNKVRGGKAKPEVQYFDDQVRLMMTDFMNDGAARGAEVYVNNKGANRNWPDGVGCLEKDNLKLKVIGPKWQSCTTFGTSFGYLEGDKYKSVESIIREMIEVISRNGNFLINIGPKADGTIPEPQLERLKAMGAWLTINGEAIYGSRYWKESGQADEHLAFTTKGTKLYAIKLRKPTAAFLISGTAGWKAEAVKSVRLLGSAAAVSSEMTPQGLQISPPSDLGKSEYAWSFEIITDEEQHHPNVVEKNVDQVLSGTKAVDLDGNDDGDTRRKRK
ncbi:alpha-L-fucosidase [Haloferula chungangensis]|uniref:alpha-L-fucosidase n=1 Tax=Haloferula chungangensis TaxID=1048331 RepID=A0ABW2LAA6_9BACT